MKIGEAQIKVVPSETPVEVVDEAGEVLRSFGGDVPQIDGPARAWNAAGTPYATLRWYADDVPGVDARLLDALQVYLSPLINDEDFWGIEWRRRPVLQREAGKVQLTCRLIVHKRSNRPDAGVIGVPEGYPSWSLPS